MSDYMEELSAALAAHSRHRDAIQETVVQLIQRADARFGDDEELRTAELQRLREDFYRAAIADKLIQTGKIASASPAELLARAQEIRDKRGYCVGGRGQSSDMRTPDEERYYQSLRVRWSNLLKKAGVAAADPRGGDTSRYRRP